VATFCGERDCSVGSVLRVLDVSVGALDRASDPIRRPPHTQTGTALFLHSFGTELYFWCFHAVLLILSYVTPLSAVDLEELRSLTVFLCCLCQETLRKVSDFMLDGPSPLGIKRYAPHGTVYRIVLCLWSTLESLTDYGIELFDLHQLFYFQSLVSFDWLPILCCAVLCCAVLCCSVQW
jgi:hypothetical protein